MTLRIGIVGCGRILAAHLRGYRLLREAGFDQFRITGLCSRRREDAESYVQRGAGPAQRTPVGAGVGDPLAVGDEYISDFQDDVAPQVFSDYESMIRSGEVDAINDFTTHELHYPVANATFSAGKHLMTQKPLATTLEEAKKMCRLADDARCTFSVFENARFRPDTQRLHWLLESKLIGRLRMIALTNIGNWWAPDLVVAQTPWRHQKARGGGLSLDIGVHLFHQFGYLAGPIATVWGQTSIQEPVRRLPTETVRCDADDTFICGFTTEQGVHGSLHLSWSGHGEPTMSGRERGICFYGETGSVIGDVVQQDDGATHSLTELYRERAQDRVEEDFPRGITDHFALNQLDWLQAIEQNRTPRTSGRHGLRDLAAAVAILESSETGRRVEIDELLGSEAE